LNIGKSYATNGCDPDLYINIFVLDHDGRSSTFVSFYRCGPNTMY